MAAPANPTAVSAALTGFISVAPNQKASPAALIKWTRPAPLPAPIEHYTLDLSDPDKVGTFTVATADGAGSAVVHLALLGSEVANQWDADESIVVKAVNVDGASAGVTVNNPFAFGTGAIAVFPLDTTDLAVPTNVVATVLSDTSISLSWDPSDTITNLTHWRIHLQHSFGELSTSLLAQDVPFWQTSIVLTGLMPGHTYAFQVAGRYAASDIFGRSDPSSSALDIVTDFVPSAPAFITTTGSPGTITGPSTLEIPVGAPAGATFDSSAGPVQGWSLINGPAGLTIESRPVPGGPLASPFLGDVAGTPSEEGVFDATVCARVRTDADEPEYLITRAVRIISYGETLLPWLHGDPHLADLQIDIRSRTVRSYVFNLEAGIRLVRGDTLRVYFPIRDGRNLVSTVVESLSVNARLTNNFNSAPLLRFKSAANTNFATPVGPLLVQYIDFATDNTVLDSIFEGLNRSPGSEEGAREIKAELELVLKLTGKNTCTPPPVKLTIAQDYDR